MDPDAPKVRPIAPIARKSQPGPKTPRPVSAGIRADPTEISEEEIAALKIKIENLSGFSFKTDERAEKLREFYSKLEEKMKAKEEEKNQHQVKNQEELENKMKLLRKSLTFKATPLPSFYQESGPPKVEMRKIPLTRPKSPKLTTSKRSSLVGERDGSRSPVARIRSDHRGSGLLKSVDSSDALKANVKKPATKIQSSTAVPPKDSGNVTPCKAAPTTAVPSPRKATTNSTTEPGTTKPQEQEKKADIVKGKSNDSKKPINNSAHVTKRPKTANVRSNKPGSKQGGVRKSFRWHETAGSSARRENLAVNQLGRPIAIDAEAEKAWVLYEEMKTVEGVVPNAQTYNHLISASCKVVQHSIIGAFGQAGQWEDAVATFSVLQEGEAQLSTILEICRGFDHIFKEHLDGLHHGGEHIFSLLDDQLPAALKKSALELFQGLVEAIIDLVHFIQRELVCNSTSETQELKPFPIAAATSSLEKFCDVSKKMTVRLVEMVQSYFTADFFSELPQEAEKGRTPNSLASDRYNEAHYWRIGSNVSVAHCQVLRGQAVFVDHVLQADLPD